MSTKLTVHIEVIIGDADRSDYIGIADSIPELIRAHYGDISVTVVDAITSSVESEYSLRQD